MERIARLEVRKAAEIAIGGPELGDAVVQAEGRDAGVVNHGSLHAATLQLLPQSRPMSAGLGQQFRDG